MSTGEAEFAAWQKDHPCPGLMQVVKAARIVERSTPWGSSAEACSELKHQIEASQSPLERATLSAQLRQMEKELFEFSAEAAVRANSVFSSPESLALLCLDLKIFAVTINAALEKRDPADPLSVAMREFENGHLFPAIKLYEAAIENAKAGKKLPPALQPECASFLLGRGDWHSISP
jgi:hypothetical protein